MEVIKNGQREQKKPTNAQLQRRISNAVLIIDKDKETDSFYFSDKGLRITITMDYAIIETGAHRHVFDFLTPGGNISKPYIYTKRFLEISLENDCAVDDGKGGKLNSFTKLMEVLKEKEDKTEYNICWFVELWLHNMFSPLYEINDTEVGSFLVYERYMHNIARQKFLLDEHKEDVTNKQFVKEILDLEKSFMEGLTEAVILKAMSDEDRANGEMEALQKMADEQALEGQINAEQPQG